MIGAGHVGVTVSETGHYTDTDYCSCVPVISRPGAGDTGKRLQ